MLALAWTWPLLTHLTWRIPSDPGDPILNTWILWWNAHAVPFSERWWNAPIFYPVHGTLALSEHLAGIALITTPLQLAGASALAAYNIAFILSYALSGFFACLVVRRLTGSSIAAFAAGMAFAFAPYRAGQLAHLQVLTSQWMPLALLAMHAYVEGGRRVWLLVFGIAWVVQALSNGYYLLFFPVLIVLWLAWFVDWRRSPRRGVAILAVWAASSLMLAPVLLQYVAVHRALGLSRTPGDMYNFSARLSSLVAAPPTLLFWRGAELQSQEGYLFPGITAVALAAAGLVASAKVTSIQRSLAARSPLLFYGAATILFWALALGPSPEPSVPSTWIRPYSWLLLLPGFGGLRAPARFAMLASLSLAIAAGIGYHRVRTFWPRARRVLVVAAIAGIAIDGLMKPLPLVTRPGRVVLPDIPGAAVLELPCDDPGLDVAAMYRAMQHQRPLINGYSGYTPPHYRILCNALRRRDPSPILELARGRPLFIMIEEDLDRDRQFTALVEALPGVRPIDGSGADKLFLLQPRPLQRTPPHGTELHASLREIAPGHVVLDLGAPRVVRSIEFPLWWHYDEMGERIAIEASADQTNWTTVWEDWTGGLALSGALEDPRATPMRFPIPDVVTRYLRIHPSPTWMQRGLSVFGPG